MVPFATYSKFCLFTYCYHITSKSILLWFEGSTFTYVSFNNHVNTSDTHWESFEHCRTSVVTAITKCILGVSLVVTNHKVVTQREICCSSVMVLSLYTSVSHSNIFEEASQPSNLAPPNLLGLHTMKFQTSRCDLSPYHYANCSSFFWGQPHCVVYVPRAQPWPPRLWNHYPQRGPNYTLWKKKPQYLSPSL